MSESGVNRGIRVARVGRAGAVLVASALLGFGCASDSTAPADGGEASETSQAQASVAATSAAPTGTTVPSLDDSAAPPTTPVITTQAPDDTPQPAASTEQDEAEGEDGTAGADEMSGDESDERSEIDAESEVVSDAAEGVDEDAVDEQAAASEEAEEEPKTEPEPEPEFVRWDRAELEELFPHCPPPSSEFADIRAQWSRHYDEFQRAHLAGRAVEVKWRPSSDVLAALYDRIRDEGYAAGGDASRWVTAEGIVPHRSIRTADRKADVERITQLLRDWMSYMLQIPPDSDHAPAAWGLRIVFDAYNHGCVTNTMWNACDHNELTHEFLQNRHLRYDAGSSTLGQALWSIVCGQAPTDEKLGDGE